MEERDGLLKCLNCGLRVARLRDGHYFSNVACVSAVPPAASKVFGVIVPSTELVQGPAKDVKIARLLDAYTLRVREETFAKIQEFSERCEQEAQAEIDAATREARQVWAQILAKAPPVMAPSVAKAEPAPVVLADEKVNWAPAPSVGKTGPSGAGSSLMAKMGQSRTNPTPPLSRPVEIASPALAKNTPPGKNDLAGSLWALDEELEEQERADDSSIQARTAWGPGAAIEGDSDVEALNTSASGLLPGPRRLLLGSDEGGGGTNDENRKIVLAQSLPVEVPSFRRQMNKSFGGGIGGDSSGDGEPEEFTRPDILAANTYKEEVRSEWLKQSRLNDDDLEFLVATKSNKHAGRVNKTAL